MSDDTIYNRLRPFFDLGDGPWSASSAQRLADLAPGALYTPPASAFALRGLLDAGGAIPTPPPTSAYAARGLVAGAMADALLPRAGALGLLDSFIPTTPTLGAIKENKRTHDSHLRVLVSALEQRGYTGILADLSTHSTPGLISWKATQRGHRPDASAKLGLTQYVFEVETEETICIEHTRQQCELFSTWAREHSGRFVLYVPSGLEARARHQLTLWGVAGEVW